MLACLQYDRRMMYQSADVTHAVATGANAMGVLLGNGFYVVEGFAKQPMIKALLVVLYADGSVQYITTNPGSDAKQGM